MAERAYGDPQGPQNLGSVNFMPRGTLIAPSNGAPAAHFDGVFAFFELTGTGTVVVPHALERVPVYAWVFEKVAGPTGDTFDVASFDKASWTTSTVRVRVSSAGSVAGARLVLVVG